MSELLTAAGIAAVNILSEVVRVRLGKPEGWKPSKQDIIDFINEIDAATPEAIKAQARRSLNLPPDVEPLHQEPQAPV